MPRTTGLWFRWLILMKVVVEATAWVVRDDVDGAKLGQIRS